MRYTASHNGKHLRGWVSRTFSFMPEYVAETQNPPVMDLHFEKCIIPSSRDFIDKDRDEMVLFPVRAVR